MRFNHFFLVVLLAALAWTNPARADTFNTCAGFISSLPAVITTQGTWCLKQDLTTAMTAGEAITIAANNVTIDCNNFKIGGQAAGPDTEARAIYAIDRLNATVRNCTVRGFDRGVFFIGPGGAGHLVHDNRFEGTTSWGITVHGNGSVVQRNMVLLTTGATSDTFIDSIGIFTRDGVDVLDNLVSRVIAAPGSQGYAFGIVVQGTSSATIRNNRIHDLQADADGFTYGIYTSAIGYPVISGNEITGEFYEDLDEAHGYKGIRCASANNRTTGNLVSGVKFPIDENCVGWADNYITE